jgi:hypothetical protein
MKDWIRKLPHPHYGKFGGAYLDAVDDDPLDALFLEHDINCHKASLEPCKTLKKMAKAEADRILYEGLKKLERKDLKKIPAINPHFPFFHRAYAKLYRWGAMKAFKPRK